MKKIRKLLLLVLCAAFVAVSALFAVACNDDKADSGDNGGTSGNEQTETTYTVTYALGDHAAADATAPAAATANKANSYKVTLPAAPAAASGWKFNGWKVGSDTELKAAGAEITVSADVTVTAQWVEDVPPAVTYTVTYALGDHPATNATVPAAATATEANGYKVTLPAAPAAASGWKFNGWKVGSDTELKAAGSEITVSANVTVTAQWAEVVYTVTYALGDHPATDAQVPAAATATEANSYKVTLPAAPKAADGWKFTGWKVGSDTELKAAGSEITVSANMTVTADWAEVVYTVTYALGDHAAEDATVPPAGTANLANSYKVTLPAAPKAADGWKFNGWRVEGDVHEAGEEITVSADLTVTATWSADTTAAEVPEAYRGSWISAGADVAPETIDITAQGATYHDQSVTLTAAADGSSYTFSATVDDVATTFTVKLLADLENRVLLLSSSSSSVYMVKENATYPTLNFSADLVGNWAPALATDGDPIEFQANALLVRGRTATVLVYDSNDTTTIIKYIVQGEIYTLTYTAATKTLTSLHYGVDDAVEVSYTKEVVEEKDDSVQLPAEYQGEWSNDDHTVVVDEEGNFTYDGESFKVYYDMGEYTFTDKSGKEWAFSLDNSGIYFRHGYSENFTLKKAGEDADAWNWGLSLDTKYAGVYTNANPETTFIIYKDGKVSVNGHKVKVTQGSGVGFYSLELDNNEYWQISGLNDSTWSEDNKVVSVMNYDGKTIKVTYASEAPDTYTEGGSTGPVGPEDPDVPGDGVFTADQQGTYKDPMAAEGGFAYTFVVSANKVEVSDAEGNTETFEGDKLVKGDGVYNLMKDGSALYTLTFGDDGSLSVYWATNFMDYRLEKEVSAPEEGIFNADQQGTYKDLTEGMYDDVVVVSANKVEMTGTETGTVTFEGAEIAKQEDGSFLLQKDGTKIQLTFGDGTVSVLEPVGWAYEFTLQKEGGSTGPEESEGFTVHYELGDHYDTNMVLPGDETLTDDTGYEVELPELDAAYGYKFLGWQKNGAGDLLAAGTSVTITENTTFNAVWDDYFEESKNVVIGQWGQDLGSGYTLKKGDKLILTGSFSGKPTTDVYQGIVTQVFVNGVVGDNYYFFRPDCPVKVVGPTFPDDWKFWGDSGCTWSTPQWVEATYKAVTGGNVVITVTLSAEGTLTVEVAFTGTDYSYTNLYTVSEKMDTALVHFATDTCTAAPANVKHYKTPDLFTADQQGVYKSADNKVTVTVTGTTVTLAVEGQEAVTTNAKDILVGAGGQYGIYTYTSATQPNQEPTVNLEFTDEGVLLVDDFAEYLGAKEVKITKQV